MLRHPKSTRRLNGRPSVRERYVSEGAVLAQELRQFDPPVHAGRLAQHARRVVADGPRQEEAHCEDRGSDVLARGRIGCAARRGSDLRARGVTDDPPYWDPEPKDDRWPWALPGRILVTVPLLSLGPRLSDFGKDVRSLSRQLYVRLTPGEGELAERLLREAAAGTYGDHAAADNRFPRRRRARFGRDATVPLGSRLRVASCEAGVRELGAATSLWTYSPRADGPSRRR
jgi:hypothetical protein